MSSKKEKSNQAATVILAEMLVHEASEMASSCGFPPQLLVQALAISTVKAALLEMRREKVEPSAELLKKLAGTMEEAYCMYVVPSDVSQKYH